LDSAAEVKVDRAAPRDAEHLIPVILTPFQLEIIKPDIDESSGFEGERLIVDSGGIRLQVQQAVWPEWLVDSV
jgi:hypothetical protein